ncbi:MAG TPA: HAD family phosphatase [Chitinophagaceae bacterium]
MKSQHSIKAIFTDIGGVLLTNGWDRGWRNRAVELFHLDPAETEERHHLTFDTYESGKLTLDEYLGRVVFYKKRSFSREQFREFMFDCSKPLPQMVQMLKQIKKKYGIKLAVISNEGRELAEYRIQKFKLNELADFFIVSSFVHFRKPDTDIFKIALDTAQVLPKEVVYIEDRPMFVQVATGLGIQGLHHVDHETTARELAKFGFKL